MGLSYSTRRKKCASNYTNSNSSFPSSDKDIGVDVNMTKTCDTEGWRDQFQSRVARRATNLSEPITAHMESSASQLDFFRMLDEKIAQGKNYDDDSHEDEEAEACTLLGTRKMYSSSTSEWNSSFPFQMEKQEHRNNCRTMTPHSLQQRGNGDETCQIFQQESTSSTSTCDQHSVLLAGFNKLPHKEHRSVGDQQYTSSKSLLYTTKSTNHNMRASEAVEGARFHLPDSLPELSCSVNVPPNKEDIYHDPDEVSSTGSRLKVSKKSMMSTRGAHQEKDNGRTKFWLNSDAYSSWPLWRIGGIGGIRQDRSNSFSHGRHRGSVGLKKRAL